MSSVFVSYRRSGSSTTTYRLVDELKHVFGEDKVFLDVESIDPGLPFAQAIQKSLKSTSVVLVIIGPQWLTITNEEGVRRLDEPDDWVRQEVKLALLAKVRVIPVLVQGAVMPDAQHLPEVIRDLSALQAFTLSESQTHWAFDLGRLAEQISRIEPKLKRRDSVAQGSAYALHYSYKVIVALAIWVVVGLTAMTTGWGDEEALLGALTMLAVGIGLCVFALKDVKQRKVKGRLGAWCVAVLCSLSLLGNIGSFYAQQHMGDVVSSSTSWNAAPPAESVQASAVNNIAGLWFGVDGSRYQMQQMGNKVSFAEYNAFGLQVGRGSGLVSGDTFRFEYFNSLLNMGAQGEARISANAMNIAITEASTGMNSSLVIYRQ